MKIAAAALLAFAATTNGFVTPSPSSASTTALNSFVQNAGAGVGVQQGQMASPGGGVQPARPSGRPSVR